MLHQISQLSGKISQRSLMVYAENSQPLSNVLNHSPGYPQARQFWLDFLSSTAWSPLKKEILLTWGKSNIEMRRYESAPGVWIFNDHQTGIVWFVWTDLHHKNAWKGTSFEVKVPEEVTDLEMVDALRRFLLVLQGK